MPGSQLKRLKASLRDQGIIGPQKSKKQKKKQAQNGLATHEKRLQRASALESIREQFNPFQFKMNARGPKFQVTSNVPVTGHAALGIKGRPGVSMSASEERVRRSVPDGESLTNRPNYSVAIPSWWTCNGETKLEGLWIAALVKMILPCLLN
jgi:hypothetical protein